MKWSGKVMSAKFVQLKKHLPPISVTPSGITMLVNCLQLKKAARSIRFSVLGSVMLVILSQLSNAASSMPVTVYSVPSYVKVAGITTSPRYLTCSGL